jgi:adenylate cyclase
MAGALPSSGLGLSLLGRMAIQASAGTHLDLPGRKDCALLAFLAITPGVSWPRDRLAALLWGNSGERHARDSLKQALLRLKRSLDPAAAPLLLANRNSVCVASDGIIVDVALFEAALREGTPDALERAMALYRGDLLDGLQVREAAFEEWLLLERERLRQLAVEAAGRSMRSSLAAGRRDRAASAARRLLALEPLHEEACRLLMQIHAEQGETAKALQLFMNLRDRLSHDLVATPEPETVQLYQSIRKVRDAGPTPTSPKTAVATPGIGARARPQIAVLPFVTIGPAADQGYFADGLTEDIITDLSRISGLLVVARHVAFTYKHKPVSLQQAGHELAVSHVVEGTVRKTADRIRITAHLIGVETGAHLWAERYERATGDIFAIQDEITASIVQALSVRLLPGEAETLGSHSTRSIEAYQCYRIGRSFYLRGIDKHSLRTARAMFARAVEIDPSYAAACALIAICDSYLSMGDPNATFESCRAYSEQALTLDPSLAEAHAVKGLLLYADGRYQKAMPSFERALALGPDLFETHFFYARNCRLQGLHEQAIGLFARAARLRSDDFRSLGLLAESCKVLNRRAEVVDAARQCLSRLQQEIVSHPDNAGALAFGSAVLAELGEDASAVEWATRALMIAPHDYLAHYNVARTYALLDQRGLALNHLETAFSGSASWQRRLGLWMASDADLDALRGERRFRALVGRIATGSSPPEPILQP